MCHNNNDFVIIGGGISAVSCVEGLLSEFEAENETKKSDNFPPKIVLISASPAVKTVTNWRQIGRAAEQFDVTHKSISSNIFGENVEIIRDKVLFLDCGKKVAKCATVDVKFRYLCIATGGKPRKIRNADDCSQFVVGIRDTETVLDFQKKIANARRIIVVGNGGIATELVYEVDGVEVIWAIRHSNISAAFFDAASADFFLSRLQNSHCNTDEPRTRTKYQAEASTSCAGAALGPDWSDRIALSGSKGNKSVTVEYECEVENIVKNDEKRSDFPITVTLTNGKCYGCDLIVSATGVLPNADWMSSSGVKFASDGGILVNERLETSENDVFACGDVCTAEWDNSDSHWLQMRLWTQARQMGTYCARSMYAKSKNQPCSLDICFEIFTHVTKFFGYKVILLGLYNGQKLEKTETENLIRRTNDEEFVKVVISNGRVQGAILIGETGLEETMENLILNRIDISAIQDGLLDGVVDIEDYFD